MLIPHLLEWWLQAIAYALVLISGTWLFIIGRPVNVVVNTFHKLLAAAWVGLVVYFFWPPVRSGPGLLAAIIYLGIAGISTIGLFISGALLSSTRTPRSALFFVHRILPIVVIVMVIMATMQLR
jgi:hypothetical protein